MKLEYVGESPGEAFIAIVNGDVSFEDFASLIEKYYCDYTGFKEVKKRVGQNREGEVYIIGGKDPLLELIKIGSGESKYFCIDRVDSSDPKVFEDFHRFLKESMLVKTVLTH